MEKIKLLFTCPHGGKEKLDIPRDRNNLPPYCDDEFIVNREIKTPELTESICKNIENLSGKQPYMIIANYDREYVDFNREELCAFEKSSILAKEKYSTYHNDISLKTNEMFSQNDLYLKKNIVYYPAITLKGWRVTY